MNKLKITISTLWGYLDDRKTMLKELTSKITSGKEVCIGYYKKMLIALKIISGVRSIVIIVGCVTATTGFLHDWFGLF